MKTTSDAITEMLDEYRDVYGMALTPATVAAFAEVLSPFQPQEISYAAIEHLKASKFAPRPAELLAIIKAKRERESVQRTKGDFWRGTEEAAQKKHTGAFKRPEGMSVLEYMEQLKSQGLTAEQAADVICG